MFPRTRVGVFLWTKDYLLQPGRGASIDRVTVLVVNGCKCASSVSSDSVCLSLKVEANRTAGLSHNVRGTFPFPVWGVTELGLG